MSIHRFSLEQIDLIATKHGWRRIDYQENIFMASYSRDGVRLNFYLSKGTVATAMTHPKKGATQLFRRRIETRLVEKVFSNPRQHTDVGYYRKRENR